eukprot:CAMPEP_0185728516 /NCGR_PEP_ID=MMETSP1171-20130828/3823_1 /TAXON_ID=374046 /ORGANISM="Helicotheca tamensis, Strain CCMP826" /LENGTH=384 /DNA_ID=CAMNT_0028397231 /DNA_START=75 /DNA_END=1229 /DNA_ORIENTATION=-
MTTGKDAPPGFRTTSGSVALVTGSSGFVGARLVEMLLERGAKKVVCFDVMEPNDVLLQRFKDAAKGDETKYSLFTGKRGDLTNKECVDAAFDSEEKIDVVYHIAALVGPFHDKSKYMAVNYHGTMHVLENCKKNKVPKLVFSSSPSTRFTGGDIEGLREDEMPIPDKFLQLYAETKAYAEQEVTKANDPPNLYTIAVAPHQVYGPHDSLFLPNLLETMGNGRLRIFGKGDNKISVCYVDNYCHGLICGADALYDDSPALAKFYVVTDGPEVFFWKMINEAGMAMGFKDLFSKFHLSYYFLMTIAHICDGLGYILGKKFKLNPFNVKMLTIHRYFSIENAKRDLEYEPLFKYEDAWQTTIGWFLKNWLPGYEAKTGKKYNSKKID